MWLVDASALGVRLEAIELATARLAGDEIARATTIIDPAQRSQWRAAHIALRLLLERRLGQAIRRQPYPLANGGRPLLPELAGAPPGLAFSLSHTDRFALIGIAAGGPIGVDIQSPRTVRLRPDRVARLIGAGEGLAADAAHIATSPSGTGPPPEIRAWVRLEAFAKARGIGVWPTLGDLDIAGRSMMAAAISADATATPDAERRHVAEAARDLAMASNLRVHDVDLAADTALHCAAIAIAHDLPATAIAQCQTPTVLAFSRALSEFE